jgi:hypothetical protein
MEIGSASRRSHSSERPSDNPCRQRASAKTRYDHPAFGKGGSLFRQGVRIQFDAR